MGMKVEFKGFDTLMGKIKEAQGNIDKVTLDCVRASADIVQQEYIAAMSAAAVSSRLINSLPSPTFEQNGNRFSTEIGYKKGSYNPNDPSDGYLAVFLNYGTPRISPRNFIAAMKKKSLPKVRKEEKKILNEALEALR